MEWTGDPSELGACGINCSNCDIHLATNNEEIAQRLAKGFSEKGIIPDATPDMFKCGGCRGDRSMHWSEDCWILKCCVDDRGQENCSQCSDFPCGKLEEWSLENEKYEKAFNRLQSL